METDRGRLRVLFLMSAAGLLAAVLTARLAYWPVVPGPAPSPTSLPKSNPLSYIVTAPGVVPTPAGSRSLASNLLGFVNDDGQGQYGLEQYYDRVLHGRDGFESSLKTGGNQPIV